jgi:hypothetical protein
MRILGAMAVVGAGVLAVAAIVAAPHVLRVARPLLREGLKHGAEALERARGVAAEVAEDVEDFVADLRARRSASANAASDKA